MKRVCKINICCHFCGRVLLSLLVGVVVTLTSLISGVSCFSQESPRRPEAEAIDARARELTPHVSDRQPLFAAPVDDRQAWSVATELSDAVNAVKRAEEVVKEPLQTVPEELYREFYNTGIRSNYEKQYGAQRQRLNTLVLGELVENKGRFLPAVEEMIHMFCDSPSWLLPAHDRNAEVYDGRAIYSDLFACELAWNLGLTYAVLREKLSPETNTLLVDNIRRRILDPFRRSITGEQKAIWWINSKHNWNAVCHMGTLGAALCVCESREERAWFLAAAEYYSKDFLDSFTADGYCSEGLGYWNYGFGHYLYSAMMAERATNGQIHLLAGEKPKKITLFACEMELVAGIYPAFADCNITAKPYSFTVGLLNKKLNLGHDSWSAAACRQRQGVRALQHVAVALFDADYLALEPDSATANVDAGLPLRSEFPDAGVVLCRPDPNEVRGSLAVAMKAGHNNELHNHNDVGSFSVVKTFRDAQGKTRATLTIQDPGGEVYTRRTFSKERYQGELLNSFGHPVPRVNGQLQQTGAQYQGEIVSRAFTDQEDRIEMEISAAYGLPELESLRRVFRYQRGAETLHDTESHSNADSGKCCGCLHVTDTATFAAGSPGTLESAFITRLEVNIIKGQGSELELQLGGEEGVRLTLTGEADGTPLELSVSTQIVGENDESVREKPTRIAVVHANPAQKVTINCVVTP
ncbi:MAG: hypothetical protein Q4G68_02190 [Planctomycetia bacterium]|nr:hypothetical protein [Planctomycetia bacterium]